MGALAIKNVTKRFGDTHILKGIDIHVDSGEFLILVGPSGCGKSTLMNIIAGLESPTSGEVHIADRVVNDVAPKDRDIAMVFQSYALYPTMNVRQNIAFGLETRGVPKREQEEIIARVAKMLQMDHLLDRKPGQLSGGQRQRVAMGRALARNPKLFLFDEPLSNLDAKLRVEMRTEIKQLHHRLKTTIVYVTHDQIEAMTLGDKIAVMKDGIIQQFGSPQQIYDAPANLFVAGFIGSPSMNFIPAHLASEGGAIGVSLQSGEAACFVPLPDSQRFARYVGKRVIVGIRPEQWDVANDGGGLDCKVDLTEPTGPDTIVFTQINGIEVQARLHPRDARAPGSVLHLRPDMGKVVLFDTETEIRIG
ncbi:ABC transporter ATP-binding protein [Jeongeupia naejangsanensis]|uniref:Sn-glycerol-3-phosphate ABC transporter ATP-binding protein UgpC n=1 Tax=Jeongeupia naejangsanensis TaxID=613195 RepID=A0ABS2BHS0_9NEIS|nr:sn-glycerol-3-phosphate ABC transporter ATP-binding protein UgpC [Jeongeupia naejangsanensis]MBM3115158.1 sn-glycerol-3-phosphate ABC transporter ATP-binding protein UgpC [Jeongeupia naejangsanensis]